MRIDIHEDLVPRVQLFDDQLVLVFELDALGLQHEFVLLVLKQRLILLHLFHSDTAQTLEVVVRHYKTLFDLLHEVVEVLPFRDFYEQTVLRHRAERHVDIEDPLVVLIPLRHINDHLILLDNEIAHTSDLVVDFPQLFIVIQSRFGPRVLQRVIKFCFKLVYRT